MKILKKEHTRHLDKKLKFRLRRYYIIAVLLVGVISFEIITHRVSLFLAFIGFLVGLAIGTITTRMFLLSWNKEAKKVISRLDIVGITILILYILFDIYRSRIIGYYVQSSYVTGTSLSVVMGIMIGRIFSTGHKIVKILQDQKLD